MSAKKYVYSFKQGSAEGSAGMKDILGGKGAGLAEMCNIGLPVPPGFTISTEMCGQYEKTGGYPEGLKDEIDQALDKLEKQMGAKLGDPKSPLLVSVRSGAAVSMPGMMDTVLNLGLNSETIKGIIAKTTNERFAWDSYRRFIQMFGDVVMGVPREKFEEALHAKKHKAKVEKDIELTTQDLKDICQEFKKIYKESTGKEFPEDAREQLDHSIKAVFRSWNNDRAITYRRINHITGLLGTAVNVQAMVFGNMGSTSGTGVCFTRNPATGASEFYGDYLDNAQGEDVVAGIRNTLPIHKLGEIMPEAYKELLINKDKLESHYHDMQDIEFTIQDKKLYMLQTRSGKRTGMASLNIAVDLVDEGKITPREALMLVEAESLNQLLFPIFDPAAKDNAIREGKLLAKGLGAGPGAGAGKIVFKAADAERIKAQDKNARLVLVRKETSPDDVGGMHVSQAIVTSTGGMTSHAAVVARQMGKCCIVGCTALQIDIAKKQLVVGGKTFKEGDFFSVDGTSAQVIEGDLPTKPSEVAQVLAGTIKPEESKIYQRFARFLSWADAVREIGVRANADNGKQASQARAYGAQGIGLCRTEHMFFDNLPPFQQLILVSKDVRRLEKLEGEDNKKAYAEAKRLYDDALAKILPAQRKDFMDIFRAMANLPVTIRLLDPPLHEFLPTEEQKQKELAQLMGVTLDKIKSKAAELHEANPMLGHRGCRLGVTYPEVYDMQVRAILEAACRVSKEGIEVLPEIMIPIVGEAREIVFFKDRIHKLADDIFKAEGARVPYMVGTMIEVPRAALTADEVAREAEFFSFGTNDLTQMTLGFSRDDVATFLPDYINRGILPRDPFEAIDQVGVGQLIEMAVKKGRTSRPELKVGICGEHGGEPTSVEFCYRTGLNYVSCSPKRIPIARLAAAQGVIRLKSKKIKAE